MDCNVKMMSKTVSLMNKTSTSYQGKMDFYEVLTDGNYTFDAALFSNGNQGLKLAKADLVLKK